MNYKMPKKLGENVSFKSDTFVIVVSIIAFMVFFSLNFGAIKRTYGYGGSSPTPITAPTPTATPTTTSSATSPSRGVATPTITSVPTATPTTPGVKLFDIVLSIESALLNKSSDLVARTQFTSFGTVPTLVNMAYKVEDSSGKEVFTEKDEVTVETEQLVTKKFKNLDIESGKYTLVLATTYGDNVKDEFKQAFEVKGASTSKSNLVKIVGIILILVIVGIGGIIIYRFIKRKKQEAKNY